jgi:hypothetical protein
MRILLEELINDEVLIFSKMIEKKGEIGEISICGNIMTEKSVNCS